MRVPFSANAASSHDPGPLAPPLPTPAAATRQSGNNPRIVLDTNVWLDWLVFDDPSTRHLAERQRAGALQIVATAAMRAEFVDVISRVTLRVLPNRRNALIARFDQLVDPRDQPADPQSTATIATPIATTFALQCTDPDDRKFIACALTSGAHALLSRDRAVLRMARRAWLTHGLIIATLPQWEAVGALSRTGGSPQSGR